MKVLVAEDTPQIAGELMIALKAAGIAADLAEDGEEAWFRGDTETYDAAILDLGLPKLDGLTVLKRWRAVGSRLPVLVLTARGAWKERVKGIYAGADDYLPKPFEMEELIARLRALIRRSAGQSAAVLTAGDLSLDTREMRISRNGKPVPLSPLEYRLLAYLIHHAARVVPATELAEHLYASGNDRDPNAIEMIVARLRRKFGSDAPLPPVVGGRGVHHDCPCHRRHRASLPLRAPCRTARPGRPCGGPAPASGRRHVRRWHARGRLAADRPAI
jgi:two-component system OmpR family response regulator